MRKERSKAFIWSSVAHLLLAILLIAGLPEVFEPKREPEPMAITVEVLPISSVSNVKPSESMPAPKPEPEKKAEAKKPSPPVKTAENTPPPPPKEEKLKPEKKQPEKKAEVKKPEEKKPKEKMKQEDLLAVLKAVKETASKESKKNSKTAEAAPNTSKSQHYDDSMPLSLSEKDAIKSQIAKCWSAPVGAKEAHNLVVWLDAQYQKDGSLINVSVASKSQARYASDSFFRAAADSAMRAVRMCAPLRNMPPEKYEGANGWHDIEMDFDPRDMVL